MKDEVSSELQEGDTSGNISWEHDIQKNRVLPFCNTSGITNIKVTYFFFYKMLLAILSTFATCHTNIAVIFIAPSTKTTGIYAPVAYRHDVDIRAN